MIHQHKPELFRAYLDESEDAATGFYAVGGFIGEARVWQELEPKWLKCLPRENFTFHATDCFTGNRDFRGMDIPARIALLNNLTDLISQHDIKLIGYGVDAITFEQYAPKPLANDFLGNRYAAPFGGVIDLACHAMGNLPGPSDWETLENGDDWEQCSFFVESNEYSPSAERTLASMRSSSSLWYRNRIGKAVYGMKCGPAGIPLLQIADLGAFLVTKHISKSSEGKIPWRIYFEKLKAAGRFYRAMLADKRSLEVLNKTHEDLKREAAEGTTLWDDM
jgi:hypothetical protein